MKAVRFYGNGVVKVEEMPIPVPKPGELLVKILSSAICGSERKGYLGEGDPDTINIPGHEAVGEVVDNNGSRVFQEGDRVAIQIMNGCGRCLYCASGTPQFCPDLIYEGRCHAQYVALPESCLVPMPADIDLGVSVLLGGDTLGVAWRATRQLPIRPGELVFVSGAGPVGLGVIFMLKAMGAYVALSEPHAFRRAFALENAGCDLALDPAQTDVRQRLMALNPAGPKISIECSGHPGAQLEALEVTRCGGHVMLCGENYQGLTLVPSVHVIHKELNVHGAFYFTASDLPGIVGLYRQGANPERLISHRASIDRAPEMFEAFFKGETGKVILDPWA